MFWEWMNEWFQGRFHEAVDIFKRSLHINEEMLGKDHEYVATSLNNLGIVLDSLVRKGKEGKGRRKREG